MSNAKFELDFEQEIREIEARLDELKREATAPEDAENVKNLRRELVAKIKETYANLTPWQTVEVARHPNRPQTRDYL
ncbi:MAG: acetyl-CoA carboxylase carboxyl transferase subunit alpha, partial [Thermoguttaceae bacterium]|nr:acetyl-CoA carboxylase carboxyl transferase subunit alpha [Thermoguttaceae bacterium]